MRCAICRSFGQSPSGDADIPTILRLRLIPQKDTFLCPENGPAHGWFHALIAECNPKWSAELHSPEEPPAVPSPRVESLPPPFTLSPLYSPTSTLSEDDACLHHLVLQPDREQRGRKTISIHAGQPLALRLALADDERARWLLSALPGLRLPLLANAACRLERFPRLMVNDPDVRQVTWATLAGISCAQRLKLSFETPTGFSHKGESLLLPEPARMLESWRRAWKRAPAMPEGADAISPDALRVTSYALHTEPLSLKGGVRIGFVGDIELTFRKDTPPEMRRAVTALASIADFLGTGAKTTLGMGQTRLHIIDSF